MAAAPQFVHLRLHTEYSLVDGIVQLDPLMAALREAGMPAVAVTDACNLFAWVKFHRTARRHGIKPICGADIPLVNPSGEDKPVWLTLLAMNEAGYRNLTCLITRAYREGLNRGRPWVDKAWLAELNEGLIALSGGFQGDVGRALLAGREALAAELLDDWRTLFPERFYLEVSRTGRAGEEDYLHAAVHLAAAKGCPVVATNAVCFLRREQFEAHEVRVCIHEGRTLDDPRRERRYSEQQYLRTPAEMAELFSDLPEALANSVEIARRCNFELATGRYHLPAFPVPEGMSEAEYFERAARAGLEERLQTILPAAAPDREARRAAYEARLAHEIETIVAMGFAGYFLIVADFIHWARENRIPVGPGRGSGAGSLVAYCLRITDLDPLAYDLLFERFLNPERISMPDFDVDFCMDNRDRVIQYVTERYGREAVAQIITFGTMAAKAVVRDVARVQGKSYGLADKLSKMIPADLGMTLERAYAQEERLREFLAEDEEAAEIWEMALQLEGITRNVGKHAGGVVIAPGALTDFCPLYCDEAGGVVTQYDKDDIEQIGLVKFDFLGLRTLTIIDRAVAMANERRAAAGEPPLVLERIPLDDPAVYALMQRAETTAVFQLESRGMKDLMKRLRPDCFEDVIALVALFRPGPLESGMVDDFINRKHGRAQVAYPHPRYQHPLLKPVLESTYGIILYQEQVMQIAQVLAGYSLGGADLLRRAMGKKKPEEMAKQRDLFLAGAARNGIEPELASAIFDLMEKFAGYGFNKSHSAAYALLAYQTAWLKCHYPAEFMAAVLTADMHNTDKVVTMVEECRALGLALLPPDVNRGDYGFTVSPEGEIVYGLGAIRGLGEGPVRAIVAARAAGPFRDLFDFACRLEPGRLNRRSLEALIRAGALDGLAPGEEPGQRRARLLAALDDALRYAEQEQRNRDAGMGDLFGGGAEAHRTTAVSWDHYREVRPLTTRQRLDGERETLGLYLTGHPIDEYAAELAHLGGTRIADLRPGREPQRLAGLVVASRTIRTRRGEPIGVFVLDDRSGRIEVTAFSDLFRSCRDKIAVDRVVVVEGVVAEDDYTGGLRMRADALWTLTEARRERLREIRLALDARRAPPDAAVLLKEILSPHREQGCPLVVDYRGHAAVGELRLPGEWRIDPDDELLHKLREAFGPEAVALRFA
ncbi:MAG: DNA-directed DNA polymerase [Porticoccaceae bacterium]|nr:MAG: DNA-directed DNA polymerase [Porticoccaceae bacterium]